MSHKNVFFCGLYFLLISFNSFAQEVTEEMLMRGKWQCHEIISKYAFYDEEGNKLTDNFRKYLGKFSATYYQDNGQLMVKYSNDYRINFEAAGLTEKAPSIILFSKNMDIREKSDSVHSYMFISQDEFKKITIETIQSLDTQKKRLENYAEIDCIITANQTQNR